jgi:hypothetical protein
VAPRAQGRALRLPLFRAEDQGIRGDTEAIKKIVPKAYAYMTNHADAKSVENPLELKQFLKEPIKGDYNPDLVNRYLELKGIVPTTEKQDLLAPVEKG